MGHLDHMQAAPRMVRIAVITLSDTRTPSTDTSGQYLQEQIVQAGHLLQAYHLIPDDPKILASTLDSLVSRVDVILCTGGTGVSARDITLSVLEPRFSQLLPGFGELFRMISYQEIGAAAMMSCATAGLIGGSTWVFALPGSRAAVQTAWQGLIASQLGHLVYEANR